MRTEPGRHRVHICSVCTLKWHTQRINDQNIIPPLQPSAVIVGSYSQTGMCPTCTDRIIHAVDSEVRAIRAPLNLRSSEPHIVLVTFDQEEHEDKA